MLNQFNKISDYILVLSIVLLIIYSGFITNKYIKVIKQGYEQKQRIAYYHGAGASLYFYECMGYAPTLTNLERMRSIEGFTQCEQLRKYLAGYDKKYRVKVDE